MMADKNWRTSYANHLVKLVKGEEPNAFAMAAHGARGVGHYGEYLTEYALTHGGLPGRMRTWSNCPRAQGRRGGGRGRARRAHAARARGVRVRVEELLGMDFRFGESTNVDAVA